jgi:proteic killer suppression protein
MQITFRNTLLEDLYQDKKVNDKQFKSNPMLVKQYIKTVNKLKYATKIEQLYQFAGLNYESLSGDRKGQSSVRINDQFRLIFEEVKENEIVKILDLVEISKHYE